MGFLRPKYWDSHSLLQGIFPTQGWNLGLLHCRQILYSLSHQGSPKILKSCFKLVQLDLALSSPSPSQWSKLLCKSVVTLGKVDSLPSRQSKRQRALLSWGRAFIPEEDHSICRGYTFSPFNFPKLIDIFRIFFTCFMHVCNVLMSPDWSIITNSK